MRSQFSVNVVGSGVAIAILAAIAAMGAIGCSSDAPPAPATSKPSLGGSSSHSIHVFAKQTDGTSTTLAFGPATDVSFGAGTPPALRPGGASASNQQASPGDIHTESLDGGTPVQTQPTVTSPATDPWSTAWALVWRAVQQCGYYADSRTDLPWHGEDPTITWYFYPADQGSDYGAGGSCSSRLQMEQNLVCVADKLGAIADAVGTVVWPALDPSDVGNLQYGSGDPPRALWSSEWDIPPQADGDRFIVRDLAIHTLALLPTLDAYTDIVFPAPMPQTPMSCSQAFAWVANPTNTSSNACLFQNVSQAVFGIAPTSSSPVVYNTPTFPPSATPLCDASNNNYAPAIAQTAVDIEAQILRSGGRLLHDLVRRDVYSDMAAAAQQSAQALDPVLGNANAWGQPGGSLYGTISHAGRVLVGRWEIGDQADFGTVADPQCENTPELGILPSAFGSELSARVQDRPIRTAGEQTAALLVERSGIVIPSCSIPTGSADALRTALRDQLLLEEKVQNNLAEPPPATALTNILAPNNISDDELIFAFQRALRTWRLLTDSADTTAAGGAPDGGMLPCAANALGDPTGATPLPAGLVLATDNSTPPMPMIAASVGGGSNGLNGIVVKGGLARGRLSTDPMARAGGMTEASQCSDTNLGYWDEWGTDQGATVSPNNTSGFQLPPVVFQDPFHVGQALERRLNLLQVAAAGLGDPVDVAKGGIAELKSWAGSTIVHAWPRQGTGGDSSVLLVRVGGMSYANDFNLATGADLTSVQNAFGFVYGPPWMAECAAHVRSDCPSGFDQTYVQTATNIADVTAQYASTGVLDNVFQMQVFLSPNFNPPIVSFGAAPGPSENHVYMVLLSDPTSAVGHGRVLGTIPLRLTAITPKPTIVGFVDAPMQRELVHDAIDLGQWVGARPPALGDPSAAESAGYCVDGVPRDLFVPLDNELVSGSTTYEDSWQAYLALAQQAATTADSLGQQLIANDLLISQNQQAAEEQLANICGDFGALSTATVGTDGTVTAGSEDPTTQACLNEPMVDVVFLGNMPSTIASTGDQTCQIKAAINCGPGDMMGCPMPTSGSTTPASAVQLCKKTTLTAGQLKIPSVSDGGAAMPPQLMSNACSDVLSKVGPSLRTGLLGQEYLQDLSDSSLSPGTLAAVSNEMKMTVDLTNRWQVTYGSDIVMDSGDQGYWPACINNGNCAQTGSKVQAAMAPGWSAVFRDCATPSAALGSCDGGGTAAELNMIKLRVTQALWMIAASAGQVPAGMISQPIPAVFTDWCASGCSGTYIPTGTATFFTGRVSALTPPVAACSGNDAQLAQKLLLGPPCQILDAADPNTTGADIQAAGPIFGVGAAFTAFEDHATQQVPYWYRSIYSPTYAPFATHIIASNDSVPFFACASSPCTSPAPTSFATLVGSASGLEGAMCPRNFGAPTGAPDATAQGGAWWQNVVTTMTSIGGDSSEGSWASSGANAGGSGWDRSVSTLVLPASQPGGGPNGANDEWYPGWGPPLTPTAWSPADRSLSFAGYGITPNGTCGAAALLLQATALACTPAPAVAEMSNPTNLGTPPSVTHLSDIPVLEAWLLLAEQTMTNVVGGLYVQEVPQRVVNDFANGTIGSGALGGTKGQAVLTMEQQIQGFPSTWTQIATDLGSIQSAIQIANLAISAAGLNEATTDGQLALDTLRAQAQMTAATDQLMETISGALGDAYTTLGGSTAVIPAAILATADAISSGQQEISQLQAMGTTANQVEQNQLAQALAQLGANTAPLWADVQKQIDNLRGAVAQIDASGQVIVQSQNQAAYQAAVGTGQDFVNVSGQEVPIPVDTVLRRQSSATLQRYQAALTNAKALAYMARRAIEQRIGVPLDALTQQIGPLDAPASWADDICSLQGVNYASLSTAIPATDADGGVIDGGGIGGSADQQAISQFADAWVGDYVAKLQNFVTYYNVQYPSHQGDDTSVLSLRYDLLGPAANCMTQAPNDVINSGDLSQFSTAGWQLTPCDPSSQKCLAVVGGYALAAPQDGPLHAWGAQGDEADAGATNGSISGATWLVDVPQVNAGDGGLGGAFGSGTEITPSGDAGAADASSPTVGWPSNLVAQQVPLQPGSYVLSWWDQARDAAGNVLYTGGSTPSSPPNYVAEVFGPSWNTVAIYDQAPYAPPQVGDGGSPSLWSSRHALSFTVTNYAIYTIAFGASTLAGGNGSVAIADVQLEQGVNGQPTTYVATMGTTMVTGLNCPMSDSDLRAAFVHNCNSAGACYYDLNVPLIIDTSALDGSPLSAKLADGNYNYRHLTAALNLVGTGLIDCTNNSNPNCYGSAFVQYDLQHDATNTGIVGYDGNSRVFNFGIAGIQHGKALAAERYLTTPLGSSDQALITQPGIQHIEFGGRPLDGTYRLRIWDSSELNWSALQDIQIVLNYEYWSQIQANDVQARRPPTLHRRRLRPTIPSQLRGR